MWGWCAASTRIRIPRMLNLRNLVNAAPYALRNEGLELVTADRIIARYEGPIRLI